MSADLAELVRQIEDARGRAVLALLPGLSPKPSRLRDRPCAFAGCSELVLRASTYCRHHLGVLHGAASARTYSCSEHCQAEHRRCSRCRCLCEGDHSRQLRDGLCYVAGAPSCWSERHGVIERPSLWLSSCLLCGRSSESRQQPPPHSRCPTCRAPLLVTLGRC